MQGVIDVINAEAALWMSARHGHVEPITVFSRLFPFPVLISALLKTFTGSTPPIEYQLLTTNACLAAAVGFLLPTVMFAALDAMLDTKAWSVFGACELNKRSTSEADRHDRFVRHPMSCYSSHAQTAAGAFILARSCADARAPLASSVFGLAQIAMGTVSFAWWASRRQMIRRLDSYLMEALTTAMAVAALAISLPEWETHLVAAFAVYVVVRAATFQGHGDFLLSTTLYTAAYIVSTQRLGGSGLLWRYIASTGVIYTGFVLKFFDTTGRGAWGTAAFHYCIGFGHVLLWTWTQSWPASA